MGLWRWLVLTIGVVVGTILPIWHGILWLLSWGEHFEFIARQIDSIREPHPMLGFILNPPPWLPVLMIFPGLLLIFLSLRGSEYHSKLRGAQASETPVRWPIREALQYLYIDSRLNSGRAIDGGKLLAATELAFLDATRNGLVRVWGRPRDDERSPWLRPIEPISADFWKRGRLALVTCMLDSPARSCTMQRNDQQTYEELEVNKDEIFKTWPRASWLSLRLDKHRQARTGVRTALRDRFPEQIN